MEWVRIVEGKSRVKALLNTALTYRILIMIVIFYIFGFVPVGLNFMIMLKYRLLE